MNDYKGYPAFPQFAHFLESMFTLTDDAGKPLDIHQCRLCKPELYATLAPGYVTCCRCGVVILTGKEDDPMNEAMDCCEQCWLDVIEELANE